MKTLLLMFLLTGSLLSLEYAVVINVNSPITKLSKKQIKDIFIMKRHFVQETKLVPVNMSASSKVRENFEKKILKINREKLNRYWTKKHFQGIRPPVVQSSNVSVKLFIKNVNGAIGYLPLSSIDSGLKVLFEF
ncbi:MAG: ABC-type phosphate transport system substrate-binding protein [Sulfurimonas sp.]|jgi:ABC-type phosphate transport system substrate-binding protein|uniref:hypothetical protein n=1 Tax=Sulfurimonas sp. TaxID=2022749 RepID=UPI0039E3B6FF